MNHNNINRSATNNMAYFGCAANLEEAYRRYCNAPGTNDRLSEFVYEFHPQFEFSVCDLVTFDSPPGKVFRVQEMERHRMLLTDSEGNLSSCGVNSKMPKMADIPKEIYEMARAAVLAEIKHGNRIP